MECPYCHSELPPHTPCMSHPPVPMSYWPTRSGMPEMFSAPELPEPDEKPHGD